MHGHRHICDQVAFSKRAVEIEWINTMEASLIFGFVIFANAMYIGYEVDNRPKDSGDFWFMMDSLFTGIFVLELALRVRAEGWKTFTIRWNQFDTVMVVMAVFDTCAALRDVHIVFT